MTHLQMENSDKQRESYSLCLDTEEWKTRVREAFIPPDLSYLNNILDIAHQTLYFLERHFPLKPKENENIITLRSACLAIKNIKNLSAVNPSPNLKCLKECLRDLLTSFRKCFPQELIEQSPEAKTLIAICEEILDSETFPDDSFQEKLITAIDNASNALNS